MKICFLENRRKFLFFGNLSTVKGIDTVLDVFKNMDESLNYELVIAGKNVEKIDFSSIASDKIKVFDNPNDIIKNIIEGDYHLEGFIWNKVYKASAIKGVFFNENISLMEDIMFSFDVGLLKNIKYSFIDLTFYHYRIFNASTTRNINVNKFNNSFLIMQDVINLTKKYSITSVPSLVYQYLNIIFLYFEKVFQNKKNLSKIEFKNHLKNIKENINICLNYQVKLNFYQKVRIISFKISKIFTYLIFVKLKNFVRNHLRTR